MISEIERKINKTRNDESQLFLSYKTFPFTDEPSVQSTVKNINKIISELKQNYSFQENREFLTDKPSRSKKNYSHWLLSREALLQCLKRISILDTPAKEVTISMSISHTKNCALAACLVSQAECGLGVDIEHKNREIKVQALKKVFLKETFNVNEIDLEKWVMKESAYKSITANNKLRLFDIEIIKNKDSETGFSAKYLNNFIDFNIFTIDGFLCSLAFNNLTRGKI